MNKLPEIRKFWLNRVLSFCETTLQQQTRSKFDQSAVSQCLSPVLILEAKRDKLIEHECHI
jgi:hypothetical protein